MHFIAPYIQNVVRSVIKQISVGFKYFNARSDGSNAASLSLEDYFCPHTSLASLGQLVCQPSHAG